VRREFAQASAEATQHELIALYNAAKRCRDCVINISRCATAKVAKRCVRDPQVCFRCSLWTAFSLGI